MVSQAITVRFRRSRRYCNAPRPSPDPSGMKCSYSSTSNLNVSRNEQAYDGSEKTNNLLLIEGERKEGLVSCILYIMFLETKKSLICFNT